MNRAIRWIVPVLVGLGFTAVLAQEVPPALMVKEGDKSVPLGLSKLAVEVRIVGWLAETRMTMTFANPHDRPLAGDLYFPLPEGATVSGYALDIQGQMVDGVVVEKDRGRQVFESIVRQGIDPGLVEWTKGNNFKTRVFPIPARGTRTIRVDCVTDLVTDKDGARYHLPLKFKDKLAEVSVRIEVVRPGGEPVVQRGAPGGLRFAGWQDGFRAEVVVKDLALADDLVLSLPAVEKQPVQVEKGPDGEFYFCINDFPVPPGERATDPSRDREGAAPPKSVTILWDASGSRGQGGQPDHKREIDLLRAYFAAFKDPVKVDLVLFRDKPAEAKRFDITRGDAGKLIGELEAVAYDGGTQISAISPPAGPQPDLYLLFTDGISNFGSEQPVGFSKPVYVFSADATANHPFLRYLAMQTGGAYFNLLKLDNAAVLAGLAGQPFSFLSAEFDKAEIAGVYPRLAQPVHGDGSRFTLVGKLLAEQGKVTVRYGRSAPASRGEVKSEFTVSRAGAPAGNLLRRYWAGQKVAELMIFPERNEEDIVATGKLYGLVTPYTSLIVLDNLEQYLQHGITPPDSLPEMRRQYEERVAKRQADEGKQKKDKLDRVVALWGERVKWWETEFKYAKDFKYKAPPERKDSGVVAALTPGRPEATADAPAPTVAPQAQRPEPAGEARPPGDAGRVLFRNGHIARSGGAGAGKDGADGEDRTIEPGVVVKPWDPKTPYIEKLRKAKPDELFPAYMTQRKEHAKSPAFFFDCANWLFAQKQAALAVQVLSNIAELELENAALLRILAYKLAEENQLDLAIATFEQVRKFRPEEPQSHRDLALVLARRAEATAAGSRDAAASDYRRAVELLYHVVLNTWDRFEEIELIALMELNAIIPRAKALGLDQIPVDPRLIKLLDLDVRIVMTWDADLTDIDLHVTEPSTEKAYYGHNRTTIGGLVSRDFTQGYGPEEYLLRRAMPGTFKVQANYFGSQAQSIQGPVTLQLDIFTNFGRANEKRKSITLRLTEKKETIDVGELEF